MRVSLLRDLPPAVSVVSPSNGAQFLAGSPITVVAEASDPDGGIRQVDFWLMHDIIGIGYQVVATLTNPPYMTSLMVGDGQNLRVSATDNSGLITFSAPVSLTVRPVRPPNDNFSNRSFISGCPVTFSGTNTNATDEGIMEPYFVWFKSVWWTWTSPFSGACTLTGVGQSFAPALTILIGDAPRFLSLVNSTHDAVAPLTTRLSFQAQAGTTYQIAVSSYNDWLSGVFTVSMVDSLPPAVSILSPTNASRFNPGATVLLAANPTDPDGAIRQVEFFFRGQSLATVTQAPFEVAVTLPPDLIGSMRLGVAATDDHGLVSPLAEVVIESVALPPPPPPNDNFAQSTAVFGWLAATDGTGLGATREPGEPNPFGYANRGSVWCSWKAPSSGTAKLWTGDSSVRIAVFAGSALQSLVLIATNSPLGDGSLAFPAQGAVTYHMAIEAGDRAFSYTLFLDTAQSHRIADAGVNPLGQLEVQFQTLSSRAWALENSTDLHMWTPIATNTSGRNVISFTDPAPLALRSNRFFRVTSWP